MLIPDTLFDCIKYEIGVFVLPSINMHRVYGKRTWLNYSPEKIAQVCKKMSQRRKNMSESAKKKDFKLMSKGMKRYWDEINAEKKKRHCDLMSKGMKNTIRNKVNTVRDVPRINTYSGVITESQMEEINA